MKASKLTFARPLDAVNWRVGDVVRFCGEERIVVTVGCGWVEMRPSTWWRRAWYAFSARSGQVGGALAGVSLGASLGGIPAAVCLGLVGAAFGLWCDR